MNNLYTHASKNTYLRYIDEVSGETFKLDELPLLTFNDSDKNLFFAYTDNSIHSISIFWSVMRTNHCIALMPPSMANQMKEEIEKLYQPKWIFDNTRDQIPLYSACEENGLKYFSYTKKTNYIIDEKIKILLSTSGTTGSPKFVKLSESNILSNANSITEYLPILHTDVTPLNLPIYYSYGLSIITSNALKGGKTICTNENLLSKIFWENLSKYSYTSFAGVPFIYEILDRIGFINKDYPSLRYITQAGGRLQEHLAKKYAHYCSTKGILFYMMYGQTEATARMSYLDPKYLPGKLGSIGKPIPGGKFIIDKTGELCYEGDNIFGGYANGIKDLKSYDQIQLLRTGDLAVKDDEDFYFITGRIKRFVKLFGSRINLDEVESLVASRKKQIVKCIGVNDKLLVLFYNDDSLHIIDIIEFISREMKIHISVIKKYFIQEFPLTANGKVNYNELKKLYEAE